MLGLGLPKVTVQDSRTLKSVRKNPDPRMPLPKLLG